MLLCWFNAAAIFQEIEKLTIGQHRVRFLQQIVSYSYGLRMLTKQTNNVTPHTMDIYLQI